MAAKLSVVGEPATSPELLQPPRKLGQHGSELWRRVQAEYQVADIGGIELLAQACAALDRAEALREQIDTEGEMIRTKNVLRDNPLLKHELANRAFISRAIGRLGLDVEPVRSIGRPAGGGYRGV